MKNQTIEELAAYTAVKLKDLGLSDGTLVQKRDKYFKYIVAFFHEQGTLEYNDAVLNSFIEMVASKQGKSWGSKYCLDLKHAAHQMQECYETGTLALHFNQGKKIFNPSKEFLSILEDAVASRSLKPDFQRSVLGYLRRFCCWLESNSINSFSEVTKETIFDYLKSSKGNRARSTIAYDIYSLKLLIRYLSENKICEICIDPSILLPASRGRKLIQPFSKSEVTDILQVVDRESPQGKRDYAILLLAITSGLRAGDIVALKLSDIDWHTYEISIVQGKTSQRLKIPLSSSTGNAIGDYILNGRPKSMCQQVFLTKVAPFRPLKGASTLDSMLSHYCTMAGVTRALRQSFHSLRRSLGTWMANSGVLIHTISQVLGHRDLGSTERYIAADMHMVECALDFSIIPVQSEVMK